MLVCTIQKADGGVLDGFEGGVTKTGTGVIAAYVETVFVDVAVAFDACLKVVLAWRGDGPVGGDVDSGWCDGIGGP